MTNMMYERNARDLRLALPEVGWVGSPHLGVLILSTRNSTTVGATSGFWSLVAHSYWVITTFSTHPLANWLTKVPATIQASELKTYFLAEKEKGYDF